MMQLLKAILFICFQLLALQTVCAQSTTPSPFDTTHYGRNNLTGKYVKTRGISLYYEIYGKGQPLLIIHGNGGSINNFLYQIPYFCKNYQVIIADSRAQGKSTDPRDSLSYEMMTDDLNALLDSLHVTSCHVIGWSDGGINGLLLAIRHPEKVKKLAVTGANLWPDSSAVDPFVYRLAMDLNDTLRKMPTNQEVKNQLKLAHLLSYEPHISTAQLHTIQCPTLVIGGDHDVILPQHTMLIAQSIPNSNLWILPNSGHATPIIYKNDFNEQVARFLEKPFRIITGTGRFE